MCFGDSDCDGDSHVLLLDGDLRESRLVGRLPVAVAPGEGWELPWEGVELSIAVDVGADVAGCPLVGGEGCEGGVQRDASGCRFRVGAGDDGTLEGRSVLI